ncbi:MAG: hypothetical protein HYZ40_18035 [Rhodospirillales bacterium]|nr:hypothetical protein [Rhodospirillales bacterium]
MKPFGSTLAVVGMCFAVAACMPPPPTTVSKEDLLSSSGFKTVSLNTPAKVAAFKNLPAHQLSRKTYKGKTAWVYPDQNICGCLYIGSQKAYDAYIKKATAKMMRDAVKANDSDDPYSPTSMDNALDYDWANDPEAYGLYNDW